MLRKRGSLAVVQVLALASVALYLAPLGAHFFEFSQKMSLTPPEYMTVQKIYEGWALFGAVIFFALLVTLLHTLMVRRNFAAFALSLAAFLGLAAALAIFFVFTLPVNVASSNWSVMPESFEAARRQWEFSHAFGAVITFAAFLALAVSVIIYEDP